MFGGVRELEAFEDTRRGREEKCTLPMMWRPHGRVLVGGVSDGLLPICEWTLMEENAKGRRAESRLFALQTERGQYLYEGLKAGTLDGISIGYRARKFTNGTKAGEPRRKLHEVDLVEASIVTFPANDKARVGSVK